VRDEALAVASTQYYTATTLDGFIAGPGESLEWLFSRAREPDGPLAYDTFIKDVGAIAMGATTYEWILAHSEGWPYEQPTWVFTHRELERRGDTEFVSGDVRPVHEAMLAAAGGGNRWIVGGGDLAGQLADAGLLDEVLVTIAPVTLGAGAPLLPHHVDLRLEELGRNGDFAAVRYSVVRS
jgi:dihydrofolate reductase